MPLAKTEFDWIILEHEDDEFPAPPAETGTCAPQRTAQLRLHGSRFRARRRVAAALAAGIVMAGLSLAGHVLVTSADEGLATMNRELEATIALEEWSAAQRRGVPAGVQTSFPVDTPGIHRTAAAPQGQTQAAHSELLDVTFYGDLAVAEALETRAYPDGQASAQRKVHFYRYDGVEWIPSAPDDDYWGPQRTLETEHLVFHYRKRDRGVVEAAAPDMDSAYAAMQEALGLPSPTGRLAIIVDPSHSQLFVPTLRGDTVRLTPPSLIPRPADLPPDQLLAWQAVPLLVEHMVQESEEVRPISETWDYMARVVGQWLVMQYNDLQEAWSADVLAWRRSASEAGGVGNPPIPSEALKELCIKHRVQERYLWLAGSEAIPACDAGSGSQDAFALYSALPLELSQIWQESSRSAFSFFYRPSPQLATTLLDYAVAAHGPDAVARLWQGFHDYRTWEELIPAVFGVSAQEFEAGWQEWQIRPVGELTSQ